MPIKSYLRGIASALGYVVIPHWRIGTLHATAHLRKLFDLLKVDCVLDVGANRGQFHDYLRDEVQFEGPIVSFEPIPEVAAAISERARADERWIVHNYALGSSAGVARFNVMKSSTLSSFLAPQHGAAQGFEDSNTVARVIDVEIRKLDDVFPELAANLQCKSVYLKLDTQGFDMEVIKGASQTLGRFVHGMQTEASVKPLYQGMPDYACAIRDLERLGFDLSGIFPLPDSEHQFPFLVEFDAVLVKRSRVCGFKRT